MARGDRNYDKVTHGASKKGTKEKQKAVWDMIGAKKKLHEMVEALIGGDSKAAATALHDYLQQKTRAILGEMDMEGEMDLDMDDEMGGEGEHDHEDGEDAECEHCHGEGCEHCENDDEEGDDEHMDLDLDDEGGDDHEHMDFDSLGESNDTKATKQSKDMHKNRAKDLDYKVKGDVKFATKGKAKLTKPHNNAAPGLDRKVKGALKL